jgi:hypothetical protein
MKRVAVLWLVALLVGCSVNESRAIISRVFPEGRERINLEVWKATNDWHFNPHGGFGNTIEFYGFAIPSLPKSRAVYSAKEIVVREVNSLTKDVPPVHGGEVVVDPEKQQVTLSLTTARGAFPGNGVYPLSFFSFDTTKCEKGKTKPCA